MKIMEISRSESAQQHGVIGNIAKDRFRRDKCFGSGQRTDDEGRKSDTTCSDVRRSSHGDQGHRERQISDHNGRI